MARLRKVTNTEQLAKQRPDMLLWVGGGATEKIHEQESQGQKSLVNSDLLPTEIRRMDCDIKEDCDLKTVLENAGVRFLGVVEDDTIFQYVNLPAGWKKLATDHPMWSDIVDNKGRKRAAIFYKAAFYDRDAHMEVAKRFAINEACDEESAKPKKVVITIVTDCENIVFSAKPLDRPREWEEERKVIQASRQIAIDWLDKKYPDWRNPGAYWD